MMENAKLDYEEIFVLKPSRKNAKTKAQGIKYLDRPFPAIKPARSVVFNATYSRFAIITDKNVYVFDNFTKQNVFKVCLEGLEMIKLLFFKEDLLALCPDGLYYFREQQDEANYRFKRHKSRAELDEAQLFDIENVNDTHVILTATNTTHVIRFIPAKGKVHLEVQFMINLGGARKLKYLHKNTDISTLYAPELQQRGVELMLFMDYTNPSALRYLVFDKEFRLVCQYHAVSVRPPEPSDSNDSSEADGDESRPDREVDEGANSPASAGGQQQASRGQGMDIEGLEAKTTTELNRPIEVKNIDNIIVVPRTNQVVIVDLANGVFLVNLDPRAAVNPAVLQPFWELDQFEKLKFRCACLCFDKNRVPLLCMFTLRQTHQHLQFRYLTKVGPKTEYGCEITESKVKAKKIFFNPLWNAFMILDFDESYYLMEFYNLNYYEKFYIRFKAIDDNQLYIEEETEFDERQPISFHSTPESEAKLFESINGRPTDHPLLQPDLDVQAYHRSNGF